MNKKMKSFIDHRPWGKFEQFTHNEISTVKVHTIYSEKRNSLQSHQNRVELWVALDDGLLVEINGTTKILKKGEKTLIPKQCQHRFGSDGKEVRVLEICFGEFDEDDNTRYEDDFGRA